MKTIEETRSITHLENNHRKINMLEEIEILKAASSKYLFNDVIAGQNEPTYKLKKKFRNPTIEIISDLNSNCQLPKPGDRRNFNTRFKE